MTIEEKNVLRAIYIELKGGDISDAFKQVLDTLVYLKNEFKNHQIDVRIIGSQGFARIY